MSTDSQNAPAGARRPPRVGLFGGSFDPVHRAHLAIARAALEQAGLDEMVFIPSSRTPLKGHPPIASAAERFAMLKFATADESRFRVDDRELREGGTSFTIDTVRALEAEAPEAGLFWLMGADQLAQFDQWREAAALARSVHLLVVARPGVRLDAPPLPDLRIVPVEVPGDEASSTEVRRLCAAGKSLAGLVPPAVEAFISENRVYSASSSRSSP